MKKLKSLPRIALVLAILLVLWFAAAMLGAKWGLIDQLFAFGTMTIGWGLILAGIVALLAIAGLLVSVLIKPRGGWGSALLALLVPLAFFGGMAALKSKAESVPFIYDITTNTADTPTYSEALTKTRAEGGANELLDFGKPLGAYDKWKGDPAHSAKTAGELIAVGYPDLATLTVDQSADDTLTAIKAAMEMRGFNNVTLDKDAGTVEGTDEVFWYGFKDDVVARVRSTEGGTAVDFRSTSRVGTSDLGVNAQRIRDLSAAVQDRLAKDFPKLKPTAPALMETEAEVTSPTVEAVPEG